MTPVNDRGLENFETEVPKYGRCFNKLIFTGECKRVRKGIWIFVSKKLAG